MAAHLEWHDGRVLSRRSQCGSASTTCSKHNVLRRLRNYVGGLAAAVAAGCAGVASRVCDDARVRGVCGACGVERMGWRAVGAGKHASAPFCQGEAVIFFRAWPVCQKTLVSVYVTRSVPTCCTKNSTSLSTS